MDQQVQVHQRLVGPFRHLVFSSQSAQSHRHHNKQVVMGIGRQTKVFPLNLGRLIRSFLHRRHKLTIPVS